MDVGFGTVWSAVADVLPERVATEAPGRQMTYAEFEDLAGRLASAWRTSGVRPGTRVAICLYNSPEYLVAMYAAFKLGAVPVNINYRYQPQEIAYLLRDSGAEALVVHSSRASRFAGPLADAKSVAHVVQVRNDDSELLKGAVTFEEVLTGHVPLADEGRPGSDQLMVYTGGTTGFPKGVVWEHRAIFSAVSHAAYGVAGLPVPETAPEIAQAARSIAQDNAASVLLPVSPLMHGTAMFFSIGTLLTGGTVVFVPSASLDPAEVWRTVEQRSVTHMVIAGNPIGRPLVEELQRAEKSGQPHALGSLKMIHSSGAAWTDDVKRAFLRSAPMTLFEWLAASEGGPFAYCEVSTEADLPSRFRPTPNTKVFAAAGEEVSPGSDEIGTLAYDGPMPQGYHDNPEMTAAVYREIGGRRYVMPGDLVKVRADGTLDFLGRASGVINTGGEKVYPAEVEAVLLTHPGVLDCAVLGVPDARWGQIVVAIVQQGVMVTPGELTAWVGDRLADHKKPRRIVFTESLNRGPSGKLDLRAVRADLKRLLAETAENRA